MENTLRHLGNRIAYLRTKRGYTQEKLAELIQYSPNHISKLELARTKPSFELLFAIAKALNIEIKDLFNFDEYKDARVLKNQVIDYISKANTQEVHLFYKIYSSINN